ncbi:copper homeostasis protein [Mycoplasmopsis californica]|uniref:Copper homeostasis protein cutC homolog n=1 Tax=Mycoplasmopsis equigenitalium TaxID=114883 RepID=A0ABY5J5R3_9BACT|nr:copper homeostasis protein CutC [Mycoplasmopsis equigenitalium]UUD37028.1 hypothetical protein NPA09_00415 [Mycoplasmopsis equigenitalium]VEU69673.1 copper homeostasis protein [Mycoplasmopsis californica]
MAVLEIISKDLKDIKILSQFNSIRTEFCSSMEHGGYTPSLSDIEELKKYSIDVALMVRFSEPFENEYSTEIVEKTLKIIQKVQNNNSISRYVCGYLKNNQIDKKLIQDLSKFKKLKFTFHRAFEQIMDKEKALEILSKSNFDTVLTSFDFYNKEELEKYKKWSKKYGISFLLGGGVKVDDIPYLLKQGFDHIHLGRAVRINNSWDEAIDENKLREVIKIMGLE